MLAVSTYLLPVSVWSLLKCHYCNLSRSLEPRRRVHARSGVIENTTWLLARGKLDSVPRSSCGDAAIPKEVRLHDSSLDILYPFPAHISLM